MTDYVPSEAAVDAARSPHLGPRWQRGERPKSGRQLLREKIQRAVAVELAAGRLRLPEDAAGR